MMIGYERVSTVGQSFDGQTQALKAAGCEEIFSDRASGASSARPQLREALRHLRAGDVLVVWKLDRLGRSLPHLVDVLADLDKRGVQFRSINEGFDTSTAAGRLLFHVAGAFAQFERDQIRERTLLGQAAARAAGKRGGRKSQVTPAKRREAARLLAEGVSVYETAGRIGVSRQALYRAMPDDIAAARDRGAGGTGD